MNPNNNIVTEKKNNLQAAREAFQNYHPKGESLTPNPNTSKVARVTSGGRLLGTSICVSPKATFTLPRANGTDDFMFTNISDREIYINMRGSNVGNGTLGLEFVINVAK